MAGREVTKLQPLLEAPLARLQESREELTKSWLLKLVETSTLEEIERVPTDRIARDLPEVFGAVIAAINCEKTVPEHMAVEQAARLAGFREAGDGDVSALARDVSSLHTVLLRAIGREIDGGDSVAAMAVAERLAEILGAVQSAAVTELAQDRSRELEWLANSDALTGLFNVRYLRQHLRHLVGVQGRYGHPFAVLLMDVDGLKRINDAHGHAAGDEVLIGVAGAMRETVRSIDTPVRMGGDEFCVLAPHQTASRARLLGQRLGAAVEHMETPDGSRVGISIGVVSCPQHGIDGDRLLELADAAMYRAKAAGERVALAVPDSPAAANGQTEQV